MELVKARVSQRIARGDFVKAKQDGRRENSGKSYFVARAAAVLAAGITFTIGWRPSCPRARPLTRGDLRPPGTLACGDYLVNHVTPCMECHSPRWTGEALVESTWAAPARTFP
jgi:hypothetical protein